MATTKFKGPINSVNGFMFNGRENTVVGGRVLGTTGGGTTVFTAASFGLSTIEFGIAQALRQGSSSSKIITAVRTYDDGGGVLSTAGSFMVQYYMSTDSTMSYGDHGACTIEFLLIGAV